MSFMFTFHRRVQQEEKTKRQNEQAQKQKWAKFTYIGKETSFITKWFKSTNVKIAFTTNNTIEKRLAVKQEAPRANMTEVECTS